MSEPAGERSVAEQRARPADVGAHPAARMPPKPRRRRQKRPTTSEGVPPHVSREHAHSTSTASVEQRLCVAEAQVTVLTEENRRLREELSRATTKEASSKAEARLLIRLQSIRHTHEVQQLKQEHATAVRTLKRATSIGPGSGHGHWQCEVGGGLVPYSLDICQLLSAHFHERTVAYFERDEYSYAVDFSAATGRADQKFVQVNEDTEMEREVTWVDTALPLPSWPDYFGSTELGRPDLSFQLEDLTASPLASLLSDCILPEDPTHLGVGRDIPTGAKEQWGRIAPADRTLSLQRAWRVHHGNAWMRYVAARQGVVGAMKRVPAERRSFLGCADGSLRKSFRDSTEKLPGTLLKEANEAYLLTGAPSNVLLDVLENGMNEKYCQRANFGCGSYFAEDAAKNDQYTGDPGTPEGLRQVLPMAVSQTTDGDRSTQVEPEPELEPEFCHGVDDDVNYLLLCRVVLGCSVRTNGVGRLPKTIDDGVVTVNLEGQEGYVFCRHNDPGPITFDNMNDDLSEGEDAYEDPHEHPDYELRKNADVSQWRELGNIAGVEGPSVPFHSLVVETTCTNQSLNREFSTATLINEGMAGGVERHREFVIFHGEQIYPEYLLAYRRGSAREPASRAHE